MIKTFFKDSWITKISLFQIKKFGNSTIADATSPGRFFDWGTLKYSMRSVVKFAPWVRKFHLVTNGQVPYWLDTSSSRVHLVTHQEIFENASSDLPTFNSNAIEHNLHRIKGLSEKFIYFNDDVFLGAPVPVDDFIYNWNGQWIYTDFLVDR